MASSNPSDGASIARAIASIAEEAAAFSGAVAKVLPAMRPMDADRFTRQHDWLSRRIAAASAAQDPLQALADICVESWRLERVTERILVRMNPIEAEPFYNQYRYFLFRLDDAFASVGMQAVGLTGQIYSIGMAVTALNADEFDSDDNLRVSRMVDPIIMLGGSVLRTGAVMLSPA